MRKELVPLRQRQCSNEVSEGCGGKLFHIQNEIKSFTITIRLINCIHYRRKNHKNLHRTCINVNSILCFISTIGLNHLVL